MNRISNPKTNRKHSPSFPQVRDPRRVRTKRKPAIPRIEEFTAFLESRGLRPSSRQVYLKAIRRFLRTADSTKAPWDKDTIHQFLDHRSGADQRLHVTSLRTFFAFLREKGVLDFDPLPREVKDRFATPLERDFENHLKQSGKSRQTVWTYMGHVRKFVMYVGYVEPDQISEEVVKAFFKESPGKKKNVAVTVGLFLKFAAARLPATVLGSAPPPKPATADLGALDLVQQKEARDDLIAKLARQVIDHYLYFQSRLQGGPDSIDEMSRLSDSSRELIQANLPLFMGLSAQGHNVHSIIDRRVKG